jgi:hypothetical protein
VVQQDQTLAVKSGQTADPTAAGLIVEEIRRQVDHQVTAADGADTKAMAIFAGVAAVAAFVGPHVVVHAPAELNLATIATVASFVLLIAALVCLLFAVKPRIGGFSNGPDVDEMAARIDDSATALERELVGAFVAVRKINEAFLKSKGDWTIRAMWSLIGTVVGMLVMVGVGVIR